MSAAGAFAVALLAGGRSQRFGSDKALYVPPGASAPMWRLQLDKLLSLAPSEVILSVAADGVAPPIVPPPGVRLIPDEMADQGPLGGLASVLAALSAPRVMVLGIDMPAVTPSALEVLLEGCAPDRGLVPRLNHRWEPLLAIYPRSLAGLARRRLEAEERSLQGFVDAGVALGAIDGWEVPAGATGWFANRNRPE